VKKTKNVWSKSNIFLLSTDNKEGVEKKPPKAAREIFLNKKTTVFLSAFCVTSLPPSLALKSGVFFPFP
jgi:hypothetical protein